MQTSAGFFLVDTGLAKKHDRLVQDLESAGARPGNLKLIILTPGNSDQASNSAALCEHFGARIAMHREDVVYVENGIL